MGELNDMTLSALRDARHARQRVRRAAVSTDANRSASSRAIEEALESSLRTAGFDVDRLDALVRESNARARETIANFMSETDRGGSDVLDATSRSVEDLRERLAQVTAASSGVPAQTFFLDTATEISATPGISLDATHLGAAPETNWARFFYDVSRGDEGWFFVGGDSVSFGFVWQNPRDEFAVVNVTGFLVFNGSCTVLSDGGFIVIKNFSRLSVDAELAIHELWNDPPTSPVAQPAQSWGLLRLFCDSSGLAAPGNIDGENVNRGLSVGFDQLVVPPRGSVRLEVACNLFWNIHSGETQSDFSFGDRRLSCPGVLIGML